jgi:anti-sigma factor RsiW
MNCGDIDELSPLWHSGELDAVRQRSFDAHVAACADCAVDLREQWTVDARLRDAIAAEPADTKELERTVMRRIARERLRRWLVPGVATAAAAVVATVLLGNAHRPAQANPAVFAPIVAPIFADAARDHTVEVIQQSPRRWRTDPVEIAALETTQGITDSDVKALEATGYRLQRAKVCRLGGTPYMHLVYAKGAREFSVYMKVRGNQPLGDNASTAGNLQLASFARGRVQALIVTDAPRGECAKFAKDAEAAL